MDRKAGNTLNHEILPKKTGVLVSKAGNIGVSRQEGNKYWSSVTRQKGRKYWSYAGRHKIMELLGRKA